MIKFRQKEFSGTITKALYNKKKIANVFRKASKRKSSMGIKKDTIKSVKELSRAKDELILNPGHVIGEEVIRPTVEAPITGVARKFFPVPGSTAAQVTFLAPIEKKFYPKPIREGLEKAGKFLGKKSAPVINATKEILQNNPGTFFPGM